MTMETMEWLNTQTLIGFADKRGHAWHYRAELQGSEPNHYDGPVPVDDVLRRLFNFEVVSESLYLARTEITADGVTTVYDEIPDRQAMVREDTRDVFGIFSDGYRGHSYREWLLDTVATILDDDLGIGSAGLLRRGAQAWVSVEVPESITTPEGVEFRPNLVACTSYDGSLATTYKRLVTNVVCDNTLAAGLREQGQQFKAKHSRYSGMRIAEAREALAIVHTVADDFASEVASLCAVEVTRQQWSQVLDALVPVPAEVGRGQTIAENKRGELNKLYTSDPRCAPWAGTAFGVMQTFNTFNHHIGTVRGVEHRAIRNQSNAILGVTEKADAKVLDAVLAVTGASVN